MTDVQQPQEIRPQPGFQESFLATSADIAIGGGAAGCGKSWAEVLEAARNVHIPGYDAIIFRRTSPELKGAGSVWDESMRLYPLFGGEPRKHKLDWTFPSGATIKFSHMHTELDVLAHQSKAYAFIGFEEITHFTEEQFWYMVSRNRTTCGVKPYMRGTCNPDPNSFIARLIAWWIGSDGYPILERSGALRYFIRVNDGLEWADNPLTLRERFGHDVQPKSFTFIPGVLEENKILMKADPGYIANLRSLPRVMRERLWRGNWKVKANAGTFFKRTEFEIVEEIPGKIIREARGWDKAATEPHEGNRDPDWTAGVKFAKLEDGRQIILHVARVRARPGEVDALMRRVTEQDGENCRVGVYRDPGQAGKVDEEHMKKLLKGYRLHIQPTNKGSGKITMATPYSSEVQAGRVMLLRGKWNEPFLDEHENFPGKGHDDMVDGASLGHKLIQRNELVHV